MNKRRLITGWRQVPASVLALRKRSAQPATVARVVAPLPPAEPPPKQQWETEGGTVATPANLPAKKNA